MPYIPYERDQSSDDSHGYPPGEPPSSIIVSSDGAPPPRHDEPRGIHRYFQPQTRPAHTPRPAIPPPTLATHLNWTPSSGPPMRLSSRPGTPATPSLTRTPSRIAVVINASSPMQRSAQSVPSEESEDSMEGLIVTSDINPPRRAAPAAAPALAPAPIPTPAALKPSLTKPISTATPKPRGRPPGRPPSTIKTGSPTPRAKPDPYAAPPTALATTQFKTESPSRTPSTQPTQKRRGRPPGWRPGMGSYANASGDYTPTTTKPTPKGPPKKRGRPAGRPGVKPTRAIWEKLKPTYIPFLCEWSGCPAELQNIDTLRQHVRIVHGLEGEEVGCRWGKCNLALKTGRTRDGQFDSERDFLRHVEERHLIPFVWHVGDGPRNTMVDYDRVKTEEEEADELPGYLFDAEGNQVTPSVLGQGLESEEEKKERRRRLRMLLLIRDRNAPLEGEEEGEGDGGM